MLHKEIISSGRIHLGTLRTWDNTGFCRYTYTDLNGDTMQAEFDTRTAFETWLGAMLLEGVKRAWPEVKLR